MPVVCPYSRVVTSTVTDLQSGLPGASADVLTQRLRELAQAELSCFYTGVKRLLNPHIYPVGLDLALYQNKSRLMEETRQRESETGNSD